METLIFGRNKPMAVDLACRVLRETGVTTLLVLQRTGLVVPLLEEAETLGIRVARYWPDYISNGHAAMTLAIRQMVSYEAPFTAICISPSRDDGATVRKLTAEGVPVVVGRFNTSREVKWYRVPSTPTPSATGTTRESTCSTSSRPG